jgi:glycosyltransferase involved in cell wall biosynthesis
MKILVVIPSKNLEGAVGAVVHRVTGLGAGLDVLVVDDGSTDGTGDEARGAGAAVAVHPVNLGKGAALKTGFEHAIRGGYDAAITIDGDGQHDPASIPEFIAAFESGRGDIIVGSRMHAVGQMPGLRVWTNRTTSRIVSLLARQEIPDSQSGYRILGRAVLEDVTRSLVTRRYDTESEILIRAGRRGYAIASIPIASIYGDSVSHINPFVDTLRFLRLVGRSIFWR